MASLWRNVIKNRINPHPISLLWSISVINCVEFRGIQEYRSQGFDNTNILTTSASRENKILWHGQWCGIRVIHQRTEYEFHKLHSLSFCQKSYVSGWPGFWLYNPDANLDCRFIFNVIWSIRLELASQLCGIQDVFKSTNKGINWMLIWIVGLFSQCNLICFLII